MKNFVNSENKCIFVRSKHVADNVFMVKKKRMTDAYTKERSSNASKRISTRFLLTGIAVLCLHVAIWGQNDSIYNSTNNNLQTIHARRATSAPAPVVPFHDTLFYVNVGIGPFSPQERAMAISERIRNAGKTYKNDFHVDSLIVFSEGGIYEIAYHDIILMTITETDARLQGKTQLELTHEYENIIKNAILQHYKDTRLTTILMRVFFILLIIIAQYFLVKLINHLFRKISKKILKLRGTVIKTIKIKSYTLMDEKKTVTFILFLVNILRYIVIFLMFYLSLPLAFSIFPATRGVANTLFGYVLKPFRNILSGIIDFIPNLIAIVVTVIVFKYLIKGLRFMADEIDKQRLTLKGFYPDWAFPTFHIVRTLLYAFMFVVIWPYLPFSDSPVFQGVSVFIGIVFTLGSSSVIGNVVSGLVLTYMRPFIIGDRIKIGDLVGNVIEKTPLVTRIRTPKNEEVTIPNSSIMTAQTFNYSESARTWGLILHTTTGMGYDVPWRKVHELLLEAAARTPNVMEEPKPFILQTALDDYYAQYQLNVYVADADKMAQIYSNLNLNTQDVFNEAGIELLSPHYRAHRDGNQSTLPEPYLPTDYKTPIFRMKVDN